MPQTASFSADPAAIAALRPETALITHLHTAIGMTVSMENEKRDTSIQTAQVY